MQKQVDIIIPIWNELSYTKMCINSIITKTSKDVNLILVDNGSDNETRDWLIQLAIQEPNIHVIRHEENKGYVGGVNSGVNYARKVTQSPFIAIITNDTICPSNWLDMLSHFDDQQVAMVGPTSNTVAGRQHVQYNNTKYNKESVDYLIGFFYIIRAEVVDQLIIKDGYYLDDRFNFGSSDDLDLSKRLRDMDYVLCIDRQVYVHHFLSKSLSKITTSLDDLHNMYYDVYLKKHGLDKKPPQRQPYIFIGVPTYGLMDHRFWKTSMQLNIPYKHSVDTIPRLSVDIARNILAEKALQLGCTHLLVLDDDMVYDDADIIIKLMQHDKDIVGVRAYTRSGNHYPCVFFSGGANDEFYQEVDFDDVGLREVEAMGMSMTLIKTDVFRKLEKPWFEFGRIKILGKGDERFGEDVYFCKKARKANFRVWCDTSIEIGHIGDNEIITRQSYHKKLKKD